MAPEDHVIDTVKGREIVSTTELFARLSNKEGLMDKTYLPNNQLTKIQKSIFQPTLPQNCTRQKVNKDCKKHEKEQGINNLLYIVSQYSYRVFKHRLC